jgi:hypothetical protein
VVPIEVSMGHVRDTYRISKRYPVGTYGIPKGYLRWYLCSNYTEKKVENDKPSIRV